MPSRTEATRGSSAQRREPEAVSPEDALSPPSPPTDDTPTIISRAAASGSVGVTDLESARSIRGRRLAHYELIEPIGVGGMAAVLRARDTQLDRFVALKILPPEMASEPENVRRFHQEARSAAKLDHENIARVFYCGEDQRLHFIAFEFVEGENLRSVIERRGRLPVGEALHYMIQVAAGLAHASQRGVVHRDIKPSNIIITPNGRAKLVDMGLARSMEPRGSNDLTQSGVTLGTFDYISPEQALEPREADARSDIYSLGCTAYHALTGRPPVPEGTAAKKLHHHQHVKPLDPREFVPSLPLEVVQILDRMIAKKPSERFATPDVLVQTLLIAARNLGGGANVPEGMLSVEPPVPPADPSRPTWWVALGLALVVVLVLLIENAAPSETPPRSPRPSRSEPPLVAGPKDAQAFRPPEQDKSGKPAGAEPVVIEVKADTTSEALAKQLAMHRDAEEIELIVASDLDLSSRAGDGNRSPMISLIVEAKRKVTIRAAEGVVRPTIRLRYDASPVTDNLVALSVQAPESDVSGLRFVVDAAGGNVPLRGLVLDGGTKHTVRNCLFVQAMPGPEPRGLISLLADAKRGQATLSVRECVFLGYGRAGRGDESYAGAEIGGQEAVTLMGRMTLKAENCAIGPHASAFRLDGGDARVELTQSTVMLPAGRSAAFESRGGAVVATRCLIARLGIDEVMTGGGRKSLERGADDASRRSEAAAVLVRQEGDGPFAYEGKDNAYHDLDGYLARGDNWMSAGWGAFRKVMAGKDNSRRVLSSPWQLSASGLVAELDRQLPDSAFRIDLDQPATRSMGGMNSRLVGVETVLGTPWLAGEVPPLEERAEPLRRVLTVEADAEDSSNGVYRTLEQAIFHARTNDIVTVRHTGRLEVESSIALNKKEPAVLTVRAARKFRPELIYREPTESDAALFRVYDHKLRLEGLDFTLQPAAATEDRQPASLALLALVGDGDCVLKDCTITLIKSDIPVAVATLGDSSKLMRLPGMTPGQRDRGPLLRLNHCTVRGEGDLLLARVPRPLKLDLNNTFAALSGSMLRVDYTGGGDGAMPVAAHRVALGMDQVTAYLGGPILRLKAEKDPAGLVPVEVRATGSLFVPVVGGRSLITVEGPEGEEKRFENKWSWTGVKNAYGKYMSMVTQEGGAEMAAPAMGPERWKTLTGDDGATFGVIPIRTPGSELQRAVPADLIGPTGFGAKLP